MAAAFGRRQPGAAQSASSTHCDRSHARADRLGQARARARSADVNTRRTRPRSLRCQRGVAMMVAILLVAFATILAAAIGFKSAMAARRSTASMALDQSLL